MKRTVNINKTYLSTPRTAIAKFFRLHEELSYWKETFEWMLENNVDNFTDDTFGDGTTNPNWTYSLWLYTDIQGTYIAVVERA